MPVPLKLVSLTCFVQSLRLSFAPSLLSMQESVNCRRKVAVWKLALIARPRPSLFGMILPVLRHPNTRRPQSSITDRCSRRPIPIYLVGQRARQTKEHPMKQRKSPLIGGIFSTMRKKCPRGGAERRFPSLPMRLVATAIPCVRNFLNPVRR